jgi:hypothetical protein
MPSMPKIQVPAIFARKPEPKPVALTTVQKLGQFFKNCCCLPCSLCGRAQEKAPVVKLTLSQKISQKALSTLSAGKNFVVAHKKAVGAAVVATAGYVYFDAVKGALISLANESSKTLLDRATDMTKMLGGQAYDVVADHPYSATGIAVAVLALPVVCSKVKQAFTQPKARH